MRVRYDPVADAVYFRLADDAIVSSDQVQPGVILDFDAAGRVVGVEMLGVKDRVPETALTTMDFGVAGQTSGTPGQA